MRRFVLLLVLLLAFLTASSVARNSDFWFHLRSGQLLAQGQFSLGSDPFAYTSGDTYWANSSWLFDLTLYGLHGWIGGAGLVVLKALLIVALAALLLSVRRPEAGIVLPVVCTTLAILAMSPRLLLQPACVSYFFLGLTLWLLWKQQEGEGQGEHSLASSLVLLAVFTLWANCDEWFLLGPVLVGLFWLGARLAGKRLTPGWLVPAGLAVSLLSPYTIRALPVLASGRVDFSMLHVFGLPSELSPVTWGSGLRQDPRFQGLFAAPWQASYLHAAANLSASALAYFILVLLGILSFLAYRPALCGWRLAVWLPFAVLAAWQARAIPFFAVVAAPITALNGQDFFVLVSARKQATPEKTNGFQAAFVLRYSSVLLVLPLLALIVLTWPGWLEGRGREGRRIAWGVQADPSLQRAAETLHNWRRQGLLADGEQIFATAPEVAHYGAWFDPGQKQFLDHRFELFQKAAHDYEEVCRALLPGLASNRSEPSGDWRKALRDNRVGIVVFYDRDPQRLFAVLAHLAGDPEHWTLLDLAGQAIIAGWNESLAPGSIARLAFDPERLAFSSPGQQPAGNLPAAPEQGPEYLPGADAYWTRMARPLPQVPWESTAATFYLHYFQDSEGQERQRSIASALRSYAAGLVGLPALGPAAPALSLQLSLAAKVLLAREGSNTFLVRDQLGPFFARLVERSPALPLLAVRAARRAVAAHPEDARAWLRLGQAYLILRGLTCERSAEGLLPPLAQLRQIQVISALEEAVRLDPDLEPVHHELAYLYGEGNAFDMALAHRHEEIRLARRAGAHPGETDEERDDRLELLDRDTAKLEELVHQRRQNYDAGSPTLEGNPEAEARMALKLGLLRHAADGVLLKASAKLFGPSAIKLELDLLLDLGRVDDVRRTLNRDQVSAHRGNLGFYDIPGARTPGVRGEGGGSNLSPLAPRLSSGVAGDQSPPYHWPAYEWLRVLEAGSTGDYGKARESLRAIRAGLAAGHEGLKRQLQARENGEWQLLPAVFSASGRAVPPPFLPLGMVAALAHFLEQKTAFETGEQLLRAQQADVCVVEALLDLEQGAADDARALFGEAQRLCAQPPAVPFAGAPIAAEYLGRYSPSR